jgi:lipoprotein NlpI
MRRFLAAVCLALFATGAQAGSYGEFNAGIVAETSGNWDSAIAHFTTALAATDLPASYRVTALVGRGGAHINKKEWDLAIADFTQALKLDPSYLETYQYRAVAYLESKHVDLAIGDITALIARKPYLVDAYGQRGELYAALDNYDAAIADFTAVINLQPKESEGYEARGAIYRAKGDLAHAMADDAQAIDLGAKNPHNYFERGLVYEEQGSYRDALHDFETAAAMAPKDENILLHLGLSSWEAGRYDEAVKTFAIIRDAAKPEFVPYAALWMWLTTAKAGGDSDGAFRAAASHYTSTDWPRPILDFYSGTGTVEGMMGAAADKDAKRQAEKICEANFYVGAWHGVHRELANAKAMLGAAAANCPTYYVERDAAAAELKRLR